MKQAWLSVLQVFTFTMLSLKTNTGCSRVVDCFSALLLCYADGFFLKHVNRLFKIVIYVDCLASLLERVYVTFQRTSHELGKNKNFYPAFCFLRCSQSQCIWFQVYVRALFDYIPLEDKATPCQEAGLPFKRGDILQVVTQDDPTWWQAKRVGDSNLRAGLIPSKQFQER